MKRVCQGNASIREIAAGHFVLTIDSDGSGYVNAQLDDYHLLPRDAYPWRAPQRMTLQARISGDCHGTYGFGLWNAPYSPLASRWPALPATAWFFGSGNGDLRWGIESAATGFKAATLAVRRLHALLLVPFAPLLMVLMRISYVYHKIWPVLMHLLGVSERMLPQDEAWHHYEIEWGIDFIIWRIDGVVAHRASCSPRGPLGLCIWVDNQWLVAGPLRWFGWGLVRSATTLEVKDFAMMNY